MALPAVSPGPEIMLTTPGGKPASRIISPRRIAVMGVKEEGFKTTLFPVATAGHNVLVARCRGKFQGTIEPTTP